MVEHNWENIGSVVSKYSANLMGSAFSAWNMAEHPQKFAESGL